MRSRRPGEAELLFPASLFTPCCYSVRNVHTLTDSLLLLQRAGGEKKKHKGGGISCWVFCSLLPSTQTLTSSLGIFFFGCFCVCVENTPSLLNFILVICRHSGARTALLGNCCHGEQKHTHSCCSRSHGKSRAFYCFLRRWGTFRGEVVASALDCGSMPTFM